MWQGRWEEERGEFEKKKSSLRNILYPSLCPLLQFLHFSCICSTWTKRMFFTHHWVYVYMCLQSKCCLFKKFKLNYKIWHLHNLCRSYEFESWGCISPWQTTTWLALPYPKWANPDCTMTTTSVWMVQLKCATGVTEWCNVDPSGIVSLITSTVIMSWNHLFCLSNGPKLKDLEFTTIQKQRKAANPHI